VDWTDLPKRKRRRIKAPQIGLLRNEVDERGGGTRFLARDGTWVGEVDGRKDVGRRIDGRIDRYVSGGVQARVDRQVLASIRVQPLDIAHRLVLRGIDAGFFTLGQSRGRDQKAGSVPAP
jgi:hypothetical protein